MATQAAIRFDSTVKDNSKKSILEWVKTRKWFAEIPARKASEHVFGPTPPNVFIGEYGYPNIFAGPMISTEEKTIDDPTELFGLNYEALVQNKVSLIRGMKQQHVKKPLENAWEVAAAINQVDVEATFKKPLEFSLTFSSFNTLAGPSGEVKKLVVADNPVIPAKVDELSEEGVKVRDALPELMNDFSYHYVQKILSAGLLGKDKRLVPTKWSITATDRMIADEHIKKVKENSLVIQPTIYSNSYLYNHFEVLLLPGSWEFEQFESWASDTGFAENIEHEYEPFWGRSDYAESEGGGYYAGRFAVSEGLSLLKRQARAIVFREVDERYAIPTGVWVVRETLRDCFKHQPTKCTDLKEAFEVLKTRLKQPMKKYFSKSRVLSQKTLSEY